MRALIHAIVGCMAVQLRTWRDWVFFAAWWSIDACQPGLETWLGVGIVVIENSDVIDLQPFVSVAVSWTCVNFRGLKLRISQPCLFSGEGLTVASDGSLVWSNHIRFTNAVLGLQNAKTLFDYRTLNPWSVSLGLAEILIYFKVLWWQFFCNIRWERPRTSSYYPMTLVGLSFHQLRILTLCIWSYSLLLT